MADPAIPEALRGLSLSANDLRLMFPEWPDSFIEDYLSVFESILTLVDVINQKNDKVKNVTVVTPADSPYAIQDDDEDVFFNTTTGDITATLPAGVSGQNFRLISVGTGDNEVTVIPFGTEFLFGENNPEFIQDFEALLITYDETEGWA